MTTPKRKRRQLAKSELWVYLAMSAQRWADTVRDGAATSAKVLAGGRAGSSDTPPLESWGPDDPMNRLMRVYKLSPEDIAKTCEAMANECETKAEHCGFEEHWDEDWEEAVPNDH